MSCYHPMVLIYTSNMVDPEQRKIVERLRLIHSHDKRIKSVNTIIVPRELAVNEGVDLRLNKARLIPCGRCIGCRLDYSRLWAVRCIKEAEQHTDNYFLTLTYDDDHLPIGSKGVPTLIENEISSFIKRLRYYMKDRFDVDGIRYFACGEYGEHTLRPHYHIILFNCPIPDLQERHPIMVDGKLKWIRQYDSNGEMLMFSPTIYTAWQEKGTCEIGQVSFESCAYVARYVVKKLYGKESDQYRDAGVIPPYLRMSRDPGIGYDWFMTNMENIYALDNFNIKRGDKVINMKPGRYSDKLLQKVDEQRFYELKEKRQKDLYDGIDCLTYQAVDVTENNHKKEYAKEMAAKELKRNL